MAAPTVTVPKTRTEGITMDQLVPLAFGWRPQLAGDAMRWTPPPATLQEAWRDLGLAFAELWADIRDAVVAAWRRVWALIKPVAAAMRPEWNRKHHARPRPARRPLQADAPPMSDQPAGRRRLNWGPFAVGATVTLLAATAVSLAVRALGDHWYVVLVAIVGTLVVCLLGASAIGALVRRPR